MKKPIKEGMIVGINYRSWGQELKTIKNKQEICNRYNEITLEQITMDEDVRNVEIIGYHKDFCIPKDSIMKMIGELKKEREKNYGEPSFYGTESYLLLYQIQILEKLLGAAPQSSPEHQREDKK